MSASASSSITADSLSASACARRMLLRVRRPDPCRAACASRAARAACSRCFWLSRYRRLSLRGRPRRRTGSSRGSIGMSVTSACTGAFSGSAGGSFGCSSSGSSTGSSSVSINVWTGTVWRRARGTGKRIRVGSGPVSAATARGRPGRPGRPGRTDRPGRPGRRPGRPGGRPGPLRGRSGSGIPDRRPGGRPGPRFFSTTGSGSGVGAGPSPSTLRRSLSACLAMPTSSGSRFLRGRPRGRRHSGQIHLPRGALSRPTHAI